MKTRHILISFVLGWGMTGCFGGGGETNQEAQEETVTITEESNTNVALFAGLGSKEAAELFLNGTAKLDTVVDTTIDISEFSYDALRMLRYWPLAAKGFWIMEADANQFFDKRMNNYYTRCYELYDEKTYETLSSFFYDAEAKASRRIRGYEDLYVTLSDEEKRFIARIEAKMEEMRKGRIVEREGAKILSPYLATNMYQISAGRDSVLEALDKYGMALAEWDNVEQLFQIYETNDYHLFPSFITSDLFLQLYHKYFSHILKNVESQKFVPMLEDLLTRLRNGAKREIGTATSQEEKEAMEYCDAYFAVAQELLTGEKGDALASEKWKDMVAKEVATCTEAKDGGTTKLINSDGVDFMYSLFKPRGNYTRSEKTKRYFRSMMWMQSVPFCLNNEESIARCEAMARLLNADEAAMSDYRAINEVLGFLIGAADNVSVLDIAEFKAVQKGASRDALTTYLGNLAKKKGLIKPQIQVSCSDKINFMPQRYTPDADIMNTMEDLTADSDRPFPRLSDVFAVFGSKAAQEVSDSFYHDTDLWKAYPDSLASTKKRLSGRNEWRKTMYGQWIECLMTLQEPTSAKYAFTTKHWAKKQLNTSLASLAEVKHDAILYAKEPCGAECGGGGDFPDPITYGYVEPNLKFWTSMKTLTKNTADMLEKCGVMWKELDEISKRIIGYMEFCEKVVKKELAGTRLDSDEYDRIRYLGSSVEWLTLELLRDVESGVTPYEWGDIESSEKYLPLVVDMYTRNIFGCQKDGVLHGAVGNPHAIYVAVDVDGETYIMRGASFMYHEFVLPPGTRMTDEEWQEKLRNGTAPGGIEWMKKYLINGKVNDNERCLYGSGC